MAAATESGAGADGSYLDRLHGIAAFDNVLFANDDCRIALCHVRGQGESSTLYRRHASVGDTVAWMLRGKG